jgi:multidrug efflux pump subunit AcrB
MAENHVTSNLLMLLIILVGLVSLTTLKQEIFPEVEMDIVSIQVVLLQAYIL